MLNFLNPSLLIALVAATIPLIIHLLSRRRIKRIPFSTIHFLKKLEKRQMRYLKIRQLLLLILRMAVIVFLVMAFARPTLPPGGGSFWSDRGHIEAVIILDNSLSLNEVQMTGSLLEEMRQAFQVLENSFGTGDKISVLQATDPLKVLVQQENFSDDIWRRVHSQIVPTYLRSDLSRALLQALQILDNSQFANREVYIISDFQSSAWTSPVKDALRSAVNPKELKIFLLPIPHKNLNNISVDSVQLVNRLIEVEQSLTLRATLTNHSPENFLNSLTSVIFDAKRVGQQNVNLEPSRSKEIQFQLIAPRKGFISGAIETESDAIIEDNRWYFSFFVPSRISVLHLLPESTQESFVPLIIQPAVKRGIFDYRRIPASEISQINLLNYDVLILEQLTDYPPALGSRVLQFAERGGGVLLIPGSDLNSSSYAQFLKQLQVGQLQELSGIPGEKRLFRQVSSIDWADPVFEGLFEERKRNFNPFEVYADYKVKPSGSARPLIRLSDRTPYLLKREVGKGVVFAFQSPLRLDWTNLPVKGFVVPLMFRLIYFGGTRKVIERKAIYCGQIFSQVFAQVEPPYDFKLLGPDGHKEKITPVFRGSNILLQVDDTALPGNYQILNREQVLTVFSVNHWPAESVMQFDDEKKLAELLPEAKYIGNTENISEIIQENRYGKELWKHFLFIALLLLGIEMVVARTSAKTPAADTVPAGVHERAS